jgi:hypothetical protein
MEVVMRADTKIPLSDIKLGEFPADLFKTSGTSPPTERTEPKVLYYITRELASAYSKEQLALQVERLKATGRWHPPSGDFTIRTNMPGDAHVIHLDDDRPLPDGCTVFDPTERQSFCDYVMDGETFVRAVHLERGRYPGLTPRTKQGLLKGSCGPGNQPWPFYDYSTRRMWWERDGWICDQVDYASIICGSPDEYHARCALELLVVILHDRNTLKVETRPPLRSNHLKRFGLNKQQPEGVQEITLYCPGHFSTADGDGTHARPRMRYRAEHLRNQPYGPRNNPTYREIVIEAQWINAADVDPSELGTPNRIVKLVGGE